MVFLYTTNDTSLASNENQEANTNGDTETLQTFSRSVHLAMSCRKGRSGTIGGSEEDELLEPGARLVSQAEVRRSTGAEREAWKTVVEVEVPNSLYKMGQWPLPPQQSLHK